MTAAEHTSFSRKLADIAKLCEMVEHVSKADACKARTIANKWMRHWESVALDPQTPARERRQAEADKRAWSFLWTAANRYARDGTETG